MMLVSLNASACAHTVNCVWLPVSTRNEIDAAGLRNVVTSSSVPSPSTSSVATPTLSTLSGACATKPPPLALNAIVSFRTSGANCARSTLTAMPGPCSSSVHAVAATAAAVGQRTDDEVMAPHRHWAVVPGITSSLLSLGRVSM